MKLGCIYTTIHMVVEFDYHSFYELKEGICPFNPNNYFIMVPNNIEEAIEDESLSLKLKDNLKELLDITESIDEFVIEISDDN